MTPTIITQKHRLTECLARINEYLSTAKAAQASGRYASAAQEWAMVQGYAAGLRSVCDDLATRKGKT